MPITYCRCIPQFLWTRILSQTVTSILKTFHHTPCGRKWPTGSFKESRRAIQNTLGMVQHHPNAVFTNHESLWMGMQGARSYAARWYRMQRISCWLHLSNNYVSFPNRPDYPTPHVKELPRKWHCALTTCQLLLPVDKERCVHICAWFQQWCSTLGFWISHSLQMKRGFISVNTTTHKTQVCGCLKIHMQSMRNHSILQ